MAVSLLSHQAIAIKWLTMPSRIGHQLKLVPNYLLLTKTGK